MTSARRARNGQKSGQAPGQATLPGTNWEDYVAALVAEQGSLSALAWKLVERGRSEDVSSIERALRRLRGRGQKDGGLLGRRLLRAFGLPASLEARARWMGLYHSPFGDLPVQLCADQLRLWDRPPVSESKARAWILLGLAGVALRKRDFDEARLRLEEAEAVADVPAARIEQRLATAFLVTRLHADAAEAEKAAQPHLEAAEKMLRLSWSELDPADAACFQARVVDHEAWAANRRQDHEAALLLYRSLPEQDVHPFASYRRDAGLAYGLFKTGRAEEALRLAKRACDHAGDGGYVRLRVMGLLMVARIEGAPSNESTLARAEAIAERLGDPELLVRVERAKRT